MTLLTRYAEQLNTVSSSSATTATEIAALTISATDLVTAGFAGGENTLILIQGANAGSNAAALFGFNIGHGTSFATRTGVATFVIEPDVAGTETGWNHFWMTRDAAFSATRNWYFGQYVATATNLLSRVRNFSVTFLALDALATTDWNWAEATGTTATQITYATGRGPSLTLQSDGSWVIIGQVDWDSGSASAHVFQKLTVGGADLMEYAFETEDVEEFYGTPVFAYVATATDGTVIQLALRSDAASTHQWLNARLAALRLNAFSQATGVYGPTSTATSLGTLDTFVEYDTLDFTLTPTATGSGRGVLALTMVHASGTATDLFQKALYGKVLRNGAEWTATDLFRCSNGLNGTSFAATPHYWAVLCASVTSTATQSFDFEAAEDADVTPPAAFTNHMACNILLETASTVTATATATGAAAMTMRTLAATGVGLAVSAAAVLPQLPVWNRNVKRWAA